MAEVIGPGDARIKFAAQRTGDLRLSPAALPALGRLAALMHRLEACGMVPILDDGLVGGNCGIVASATCSERSDGSDSGGGSRSTAAGAAESGGGAEGGRSSSGGGGALQGGVLISRSGKPPGHTLQAGDWVLLRRFDPGGWSAEYESATEAARPSSDAPLHAAALGPGAARRYGWAEAPAVAVHGHALAEGPGLERARRAGLPISERETLFSTPDDLAELEALFRSHPYPAHRCFIRRGHGFTLLARSVAEAEQLLDGMLLPVLQS